MNGLLFQSDKGYERRPFSEKLSPFIPPLIPLTQQTIPKGLVDK